MCAASAAKTSGVWSLLVAAACVASTEAGAVSGSSSGGTFPLPRQHVVHLVAVAEGHIGILKLRVPEPHGVLLLAAGVGMLLLLRRVSRRG